MLMILQILGFTYLGFLAIRLLVSLINLMSQPYLKSMNNSIDEKVSVLIPARNEEKNIGKLIEELKQQNLKPIEIIVYNDDSDDATAKIVEQFMLTTPNLKLINGASLPEGWLGKNHACYQLAKHATGKYLLFLDADVTLDRDLIASAIYRIKKHSLMLLSIFPKQNMKSFGELLVVPLMYNILVSLLPIRLIRSNTNPSLAAANGQFMLFEKESYNKIQPHAWVKNCAVEDIRIIKLYKKFHLNVETLLSKGIVSCRMYHSFNEAYIGFQKNISHFFGNNYLLMFFYATMNLLGVFLLCILPEMYSVMGLVILVLLQVNMLALSSQPIRRVIYAPLQSAVTLGVAISSFINGKRENLKWKGRIIKT